MNLGAQKGRKNGKFSRGVLFQNFLEHTSRKNPVSGRFKFCVGRWEA